MHVARIEVFGFKSFMERLMFPFYRYTTSDDPTPSLFPKRIHTGFVYTMGAPEERVNEVGYENAV